MSLTHRGLWKRVFRRNFTEDSHKKAIEARDPGLLEENPLVRGILESCEPFMKFDRADRANAYLEMRSRMPNASAGTLRKLRKRLGIDE